MRSKREWMMSNVSGEDNREQKGSEVAMWSVRGKDSCEEVCWCGDNSVGNEERKSVDSSMWSEVWWCGVNSGSQVSALCGARSERGERVTEWAGVVRCRGAGESRAGALAELECESV